MMNSLYHYKAKVRSVYDGDTITVDIDLGLNVWVYGEKIRLYGINTPELRGETRDAGLAARDYLRALIDSGEVIIRTVKDKTEKYGRLLGEIYLDIDGEQVNVNQQMIKNGFAVPYMVNE